MAVMYEEKTTRKLLEALGFTVDACEISKDHFLREGEGGDIKAKNNEKKVQGCIVVDPVLFVTARKNPDQKRDDAYLQSFKKEAEEKQNKIFEMYQEVMRSAKK